METPDWLRRRGGDLKLGSDRKTWFVLFGQRPQYALEPIPAQNKFVCAIRQTINGQRLPTAATYASSDEALRGGMDELCRQLGWA